MELGLRSGHAGSEPTAKMRRKDDRLFLSIAPHLGCWYKRETEKFPAAACGGLSPLDACGSVPFSWEMMSWFAER